MGHMKRGEKNRQPGVGEGKKNTKKKDPYNGVGSKKEGKKPKSPKGSRGVEGEFLREKPDKERQFKKKTTGGRRKGTQGIESMSANAQKKLEETELQDPPLPYKKEKPQLEEIKTWKGLKRSAEGERKTRSWDWTVIS